MSYETMGASCWLPRSWLRRYQNGNVESTTSRLGHAAHSEIAWTSDINVSGCCKMSIRHVSPASENLHANWQERSELQLEQDETWNYTLSYIHAVVGFVHPM